MQRVLSYQLRVVIVAALCAAASPADERKVDPTFLHRFVPTLQEKASDVTTSTCHYKPIFGWGDPGSGIVRGVARYGEVTLDPRGSSELVSYPGEEQIYVILEGTGVLHYGADQAPVRKHDFMYLPPGIRHGIANPSDKRCRLMVMGYKIPAGETVEPPSKLLVANIDDQKKAVAGGHPPSTLYQSLIGKPERNKFQVGQVITSLFVMNFAPDGTNFPHHHEDEEEIYLVLEGHGAMVAGSGVNGVEGRYPAKPGDAYFFRLNCTVGFYNTDEPGAKVARILAARSLFPRSRR